MTSPLMHPHGRHWKTASKNWKQKIGNLPFKRCSGNSKAFGEERSNEQKAKIVAKLREQFQLTETLAAINFPKSTFMHRQKKWSEEDQTGKLQTKKFYLDPYMDMYNLEIISYVLSDQPYGVIML